MKLNKDKLRNNVVLLVIFVIALAGFLFFSKSLAVYVASGESTANIDLAFSILNVDELEKDIKLSNIQPGSGINSYSFSVSNYLDDKIIDVNMEYVLKVITTTNLPLTYKLYDWNGNLIDCTYQYETDDDGTIFYVMKTKPYQFNYKDKRTDEFRLTYELDAKYDDNKYQDIIELISVKVEARQV